MGGVQRVRLYGMFRSANDLAGNVAPTVHYNWTVNTDVPETVRGGALRKDGGRREIEQEIVSAVYSTFCIDDEGRMAAIMFVFACHPLSPFSCKPHFVLCFWYGLFFLSR